MTTTASMTRPTSPPSSRRATSRPAPVEAARWGQGGREETALEGSVGSPVCSLGVKPKGRMVCTTYKVHIVEISRGEIFHTRLNGRKQNILFCSGEFTSVVYNVLRCSPRTTGTNPNHAYRTQPIGLRPV